MELPSQHLQKAVEQIANLPGIGRKTAVRLALHLLRQPKEQVESLAESLVKMSQNTIRCVRCHNISDSERCPICSNDNRQQSLLCVVEDVRDVLAIESTTMFGGLYHVLGGRVSPVEGISPADLEIESLVRRCGSENIEEIIFALSPTIEGDTTAYYIYKLLPKEGGIKYSSIARGVSIGGELQYTDEQTLGRSLQNRVPYEGVL